MLAAPLDGRAQRERELVIAGLGCHDDEVSGSGAAANFPTNASERSSETTQSRDGKMLARQIELPGSVTVAQEILVLFVLVRIQAG